MRRIPNVDGFPTHSTSAVRYRLVLAPLLAGLACATALDPAFCADVPPERDPRQSLARATEDLLARRRAGDLAGSARALARISHAHAELGEIDRALRVAQEALGEARTSDERGAVLQALFARGDAFFYQGEYALALEDYDASHEMARSLDEPQATADAVKNVGVALKYLERYEESIARLEGALGLYRELGDAYGVASSLENLGGAFASLGDLQRSFAIYQESLAIVGELNDEWAMQHALVRIGALYLQAGIPQEALEPLGRALEITERLHLAQDESWSLSALARAMASVGRRDEALRLTRRNLDLSLRAANRITLSYRYAELGLRHLVSDPGQSLAYVEMARRLVQEMGLREPWHLRALRARARRALGDLDGAIEDYRLSVDAIESVRHSISSERLRAMFFEQHQHVYQEMVETLFERDARSGGGGVGPDMAAAFAMAERARARGLTEAVAAARLDPDPEGDPELHEKELTLLARIGSLQVHLERLEQGPASHESLAEQRRALERAEEEWEDLVQTLRRRSPRWAALHYPEPLSAREAQALLRDDEALLSLMLTQRHVFALLLTTRGVRGWRLSSSAREMEDRVRNYVELIARSKEDGEEEWRETGRRLSEDLVAPLASDLGLGVRHLIVAPDGVLHFLPFEALRDVHEGGPEEAPFLVERVAISYAPSATALGQLRAMAPARTGPAATEGVLAFASPWSGGPEAARVRGAGWRILEEEGLELDPLPHGVREARAALDAAGGRGRMHTGTQATEARLKNETLRDYRVLHFATHGLLSQRRGGSALVLAPDVPSGEDGLLLVREIYGLRLASDLVVLSACRSARGRVLGGEGVQGLAQAFLHAGSRAVLGSLWDVRDQSAAALMERFYRELATGLTMDEALRRAKVALMKRSSTAAPRHWAAFVLIGSARQTVPLPGTVRWETALSWAAGAAGAVAALIVLGRFSMLRRRPDSRPRAGMR